MLWKWRYLTETVPDGSVSLIEFARFPAIGSVAEQWRYT
jgi:hypothetical protein